MLSIILVYDFSFLNLFYYYSVILSGIAFRHPYGHLKGDRWTPIWTPEFDHPLPGGIPQCHNRPPHNYDLPHLVTPLKKDVPDAQNILALFLWLKIQKI
jgi:hypothetical protein